MSSERTTGLWTFTSDSCGYTLYLDGKPQGGARTMGTGTRTSDGRRRHWAHRRADVKMYREQAERHCAQRNAAKSQ